MDAFTRITGGVSAYAYTKTETKKRSEKTEAAAETKPATAADSAGKTEYTAGSRVGSPALTEKAAKYYESLKQKFGSMEFVLVSSDMKSTAQSMAGTFARADRKVVLIDEEKIEKMASDENYRAKYESIIEGAAGKMEEMQSGLAATGADIRGFGMQVKDDGTVSYFAVCNKSLSETRAKLEAKRAEKREAAKAEAKKEAKAEAEEKLAEKRAEAKEALDDLTEDEAKEVLASVETIEASSMEELIRKVQDFSQNLFTSRTETEAEKYVGKNFDFSL